MGSGLTLRAGGLWPFAPRQVVTIGESRTSERGAFWWQGALGVLECACGNCFAHPDLSQSCETRKSGILNPSNSAGKIR